MTHPTSTRYSKAFCLKCLADRNPSGGIRRNGFFICRGCRPANKEQK